MATDRIGQFQYRRFAPAMPALRPDGHELARHAVLIVGGGPVGLSIALGLARRGIRSVVFEADDAVCEGSRAACISRRSLEILDRLGVAQAFVDKGLAWTRGRSYYGTDEVLVFDMPSQPGDKFPPMINLEQFYSEQFLLDAIDAINAHAPGMVDIRWASTVDALQRRPDGVTLGVANALGRYESSGDWLLATDGGQSFVRNSLGLELHGTAYQGRYAIVDIELHSSYPTERRAWFDPPWARGTTILMHRQPDDLWRVDFQLAAGQDAAQVLSPEQVRLFVQTHLDAIGEGHLAWTPVWSSIYRAGAMTLDAYRHGRILFAGNAAHAMPIFGVRGLNSGFDDGDNLCWKLAAVIQGQGGDALLDSYDTERLQAFHENAANAMRSTEFMSPPNRGFELMREAALSLAVRHRGIARLVNPRQTQAIHYVNSPLSTPSSSFAHGPEAGAPLIDAPVRDGMHLTDLLARDGGFTALVFGDPAGSDALAGNLRAGNQGGMPCHCVSLPLDDDADTGRRLATLYDARPGTVYLVRPDGHVCGRWRSPDAATVRSALRLACCQ
ncbi:MAG: FAD-dependent monooxygenase [Rhodoferax sp.]|nr:FAD-dependent monooxygenase [Rhodoferax sp.]